ncbi:MAG: response regulator [Nisaea sp.]|uniref:hybrid sensor histidine kinase/response regulator n=1 Tax=Nisaea sp. TaxID=2024842 RepID=UPI001B21536E|nr:ATP-binding protein [Nisaea sp.]MBO6559311.1 response regulator [Nisaea sp.]
MTEPNSRPSSGGSGRQFSLLADLSNDLVASTNLSEVRDLIASRLPEILDCDRALLVVRGDDGRAQVVEPKRPEEVADLSSLSAFVDACFQTRDAIAKPRLPAEDPDRLSAIAAPLIVAGEILGAVVAISENADAFSGTDRDIVRSVAAPTAAMLFAFRNGAGDLAAERDRSRQLHEDLEAALQAIPHPIVIYDKDFNFRAWNDAFVEIQGYTNELMRKMGGMAGLLRYELETKKTVPNMTFDEVWEQYQRYYKTPDLDYSYQYWPKRGKHIERRTRQTASGGWVSVLVDVTDWMNDQEEIQRAKEDAEAAARAKATFLANMSHEIRTPLNAIIGFTQLVLRGDLSDKHRDQLTQVEGSSQLLLRIIDDILDFSRIDAGMLELEQVCFGRDEILNNVLTLAGNQIRSPEVDLYLSVGDGVPESFVGDPLRLAQVLLNLTSNAVKFTRRGAITLSLSLVEREAEAATVRFDVIDSGIGMTPDQVAKLFKAFSQADSSTTRQYGGTGLGLAISRALVELMGGEIGVESEIDRGSTFHVTLKLAVAEELEASLASHRDEGAEWLRALVVDGTEIGRGLISAAFARAGVIVDAVADCDEAARAIGAATPPFDLVVLDRTLASPENAARLRSALDERPAAEGSRTGRRLLVAASGLQADEDSLLEGMDGLMAKAVPPAQLRDLLLKQFGLQPSAIGPDSDLEQRLSADLSGISVLVVEDNAVNQKVAREMLERIGIHVTVAANGREAVEKVLSQPASAFSAILMDLQLPEMDGITAARKILGDPAYRSVPIIAMTANAFGEDRIRTREAGMVDHIAKPIDPVRLYETLGRHRTRAPVSC